PVPDAPAKPASGACAHSRTADEHTILSTKSSDGETTEAAAAVGRSTEAEPEEVVPSTESETVGKNSLDVDIKVVTKGAKQMQTGPSGTSTESPWSWSFTVSPTCLAGKTPVPPGCKMQCMMAMNELHADVLVKEKCSLNRENKAKLDIVGYTHQHAVQVTPGTLELRTNSSSYQRVRGRDDSPETAKTKWKGATTNTLVRTVPGVIVHVPDVPAATAGGGTGSTEGLPRPSSVDDDSPQKKESEESSREEQRIEERYGGAKRKHKHKHRHSHGTKEHRSTKEKKKEKREKSEERRGAKK
ncbi:MAG: hypothetical protein MJA29_00455, partial [Candidatus Omnitrophica bacterium]|nr:hypothetical protein [Candidatus Omnitrophota bacterium]